MLYDSTSRMILLNTFQAVESATICLKSTHEQKSEHTNRYTWSGQFSCGEPDYKQENES
jgi:hypothetical protein